VGFKLENDGGGNGSLALSTRGILPHHSRYFIPVGGTSVWGIGGGETCVRGVITFVHHLLQSPYSCIFSVACCVNFKVFLADLSTKNMTQNRFSGWVC
jgi:hypothetical protein